MTRSTRSLIPAGFLLGALCSPGSIGCSSRPETVEVSGAVTYEGRPVTEGTIFFEPDTAAGNTGPQGIAEFREGNYRTNPAFGAKPGPNIMRVELSVSPPGATKSVESDAPVPQGTVVGVFEKKVTIPPEGPATLDLSIGRQELRR